MKNTQKRFYTMDNVGSSKYSISDCDGVKTHPDGSAFYGIELFKNKKKFNLARKELLDNGYKEVPQWEK